MIRVACAQMNPTVGDLKANQRMMAVFLDRAREQAVDLIAFPELALTGYPPEDLLLVPSFVEDNLRQLKELASQVHGLVAVVGFVDRQQGCLYNAAAVIAGGSVKGIYRKHLLPNYGVFDEKRYFRSGKDPGLYRLGKCVFGLSICEDIWHAHGPVKDQISKGAQLLVNINASPYHLGKRREREAIVRRLARACNRPLVYVNCTGGQDELVFDGQSIVVDARGAVIARENAFQEELLVCDLALRSVGHRRHKTAIDVGAPAPVKKKPALRRKLSVHLDNRQEIYKALVMGLRDYARKNGFRKAVVGLSGGIDSSLVACLAVDALGRDNVTGVFMPSRHSSQESGADAELLAQNLEISFKNISVEHIYRMYLLVFEPHFLGMPRDVAEENMQARIRGNVLMALANKFGWLVLATGNKSEMSTGYATLYGDMAGGLALIKDVPKTMVYELSAYRNALKPVIPSRVFTKPPTAELRPNQKDTDALPAYSVLDPILKAYIEEDRSCQEIIRQGHDSETVKTVIKLVDASEYKRRQSAPGIKITPKAFGRDRRMPITNCYRRSLAETGDIRQKGGADDL